MAAEIRPLIQNVTLVHKGGSSYAGFVDAKFGGKPERLTLEVTHTDKPFSGS